LKPSSGYVHRLLRQAFSELLRLFVRSTVRFGVARRAWLRVAEDPRRVQLRRHLVQARAFPGVVTASLDSLGIPARQISMHVGSPWDQVAAQIWWEEARCYEPPVSGLIAALGRRSQRVVVVGANTGFYCLVLAIEPDGPHVEAVEPWPPAVERLRQNVDLNNVAERVAVWPVAAGPEGGTMPLHVPPPLADGWPFEMSASLSATYRQRHQQTFDVGVTTIDAIRETASTPIDLMLVDAEGFDCEVLTGAHGTVASDRPIIFTEVTSDEIDGMNALLDHWGYVTVELAPNGLWLRDRMIRPVHTFGHVLDSATGADCWISAVLPVSRLSALVAAAAECALPLYGQDLIARSSRSANRGSTLG
jgi:FkbM family methyltransferase